MSIPKFGEITRTQSLDPGVFTTDKGFEVLGYLRGPIPDDTAVICANDDDEADQDTQEINTTRFGEITRAQTPALIPFVTEKGIEVLGYLTGPSANDALVSMEIEDPENTDEDAVTMEDAPEDVYSFETPPPPRLRDLEVLCRSGFFNITHIRRDPAVRARFYLAVIDQVRKDPTHTARLRARLETSRALIEADFKALSFDLLPPEITADLLHRLDQTFPGFIKH